MCLLRLLFIVVLLAGKPDARYERSPDMATNIWQGTDGNWDTAGNWSNGAKPANGDFVIFDGAISQGSVTSEHGNESAVSLAGMWSLSNYRGSVGTSSTPLDIGIAGQMVWRGSGALHLSESATTRVLCESGNAVDAVSLYGVGVEIVVKFGKLIVTGTHSVDITTLAMLDGECEILDNTAAPGTIQVGGVLMTGGLVTNSRPMETAGTPFWVIAGGHWHQILNGSTGLPLVIMGGLVTWDTTTTLVTSDQLGGVLDYLNTGEAKTLAKHTIYGGDVLTGAQTTVTAQHDWRPDFPDLP